MVLFFLIIASEIFISEELVRSFAIPFSILRKYAINKDRNRRGSHPNALEPRLLSGQITKSPEKHNTDIYIYFPVPKLKIISHKHTKTPSRRIKVLFGQNIDSIGFPAINNTSTQRSSARRLIRAPPRYKKSIPNADGQDLWKSFETAWKISVVFVFAFHTSLSYSRRPSLSLRYFNCLFRTIFSPTFKNESTQSPDTTIHRTTLLLVRRSATRSLANPLHTYSAFFITFRKKVLIIVCLQHSQ